MISRVLLLSQQHKRRRMLCAKPAQCPMSHAMVLCICYCFTLNVPYMLQQTTGRNRFVALRTSSSPLESKCCLACLALLCCAAGLLVSAQPKLPFLAQEMTPLHYACGNGRLQVVQFLLRHGAKPSLKDEDVIILLIEYVLSPSADTDLTCTTSCHTATVYHIVVLLAGDIHICCQDAAVSILMLVANAMQTMAAMLVT